MPFDTAVTAHPSRRAPAAIISAEAILKRGIDIVGAAVLLVLLAPVFAFVMLLVSMDGGPAIFAHQRVGRDGKPFGCLKFRTMVVGAEECLREYLALHPEEAEEWQREQKLAFDPRVTGIGRMLRRTSLDELPQLMNVLRGEMSLVGPRPVTQSEIEERYGRFAVVATSVRPGVTGLWQVSGRNDIDYERRVALDVRYVAEWSLAQDIRILFMTIRVVLDRSGAR
jgi:Undecaprenyl-phosphate galactose phosphotransferase WbaP